MVLHNANCDLIILLIFSSVVGVKSFEGIFPRQDSITGIHFDACETRTMGYETAQKTDAESVVPGEFGGMWFLKDELGANELGITVLELEPGGKGKEHDESESGQEEVYYVVSGTVDIHLGEETVTVGPEEAIRLDSTQQRQIENNGDQRAKLVLAGAPLGREG